MTLVASGLRRSFGKHLAVADAGITLTPGRMTGLVGPNGAGKTTLLLMLAGLLSPDAGTITLDGAAPDPRELRARIGWMPDVFGTWESLTPIEILKTFGALHGLSNAESAGRAQELLTAVHLTEHAARPASELSRGQKQRLGLARALLHRPQILLLDEPASGMDPRSRIELRELLRGVAEQGAAILISSHILTELDEMVDEVVLMTAGATRPAERPRGGSWRLRLAGQAESDAVVVQLDDDAAAAGYLAGLIGDGQAVAEFSRISSGLEQAYLALDADRT